MHEAKHEATYKATIAGLYIYPIKSCAGLVLNEATLTPFGLRSTDNSIGDRQWMIIDDSGVMQTQRKRPTMATLHTHINDDGLYLACAGLGEICILTFDKEPNALPASARPRTIETSIWADKVDAEIAEPFINEWLTTALKSKRPLKLVKYQDQNLRQPGQIARFGQSARHFADAAPYLIASLESLKALNTRLIAKQQDIVSLKNFRPNIVLSGLLAFQEHQIKYMHNEENTQMPHNKVSLNFIDHCQRCIMITIDPETGSHRPKASPFKELAEINAMPNNPKAPAFGVNASFEPAQHRPQLLQPESAIKSKITVGQNVICR